MIMDKQGIQALRTGTTEWVAAAVSASSSESDRQPKIIIRSSRTVKKIQVGVSPDCSYRLVKAAIETAKKEICLYIYNVSADHMLDLLRQAKARQVAIRIMYDVMDTRGGERDKLAALGVDLKEAPSTDGRRVFTVCHQKFAVIDESILLLGSANWAGTSIPLIPIPGQFKKGNREWVVRIDHSALARWFKKVFQADWDIPVVERGPGMLMIEAPLPAPSQAMPSLLAAPPPQVFDIQTVEFQKGVKVTPVLSPNNYFDVIHREIMKAKASVDIEQQYILAGGAGSKIEGLLELLEQRKSELEIRIMVSPAFRQADGNDSWTLSVKTLEAFSLKDRLKAMNLDIFTHLHNKGVIIDRQKVLISSTNWSENSISRAREAGVLIEAPEIAEYYAQVFDVDWRVGWDPAMLANQSIPAFRGVGAPPFDEIAEVHHADQV
jgi:phosphatidylserine/phosphatidylglycerophosphate/cardiolipin synthase-like enzyme